jgi:K+-transporting ATPase ATPase C chain
MLAIVRPAIALFALFTALTGLAYPAALTALSQLLFAERANGTLVHEGERVVGSALIGQLFTSERYFWSRPSAIGSFAYDASTSSGSNLGPLNPALHDAVRSRVEALRAADPGNDARVPIDLVTASGSGLDPHVSPAAAFHQVRRVARARGASETEIRALVERHVEGRTFGLLGEPRVNVLLLNRELDRTTRASP